jgi:hypothetical protein
MNFPANFRIDPRKRYTGSMDWTILRRNRWYTPRTPEEAQVLAAEWEKGLLVRKQMPGEAYPVYRLPMVSR